MKVIPVAAYAMNICRFNTGEMKELDETIKRELWGKNMLWNQASNERLYLKREKGRRRLKLLRDMYKETRLCVACYMAKSTRRRIEAAWRRDTIKEENTIVVELVENDGTSWSETVLWREIDKTWRWGNWWRKRMETNVAESEDLFAESNGIQENRKLQDKGTAKPILPRTRRWMS